MGRTGRRTFGPQRSKYSPSRLLGHCCVAQPRVSSSESSAIDAKLLDQWHARPIANPVRGNSEERPKSSKMLMKWDNRRDGRKFHSENLVRHVTIHFFTLKFPFVT
jgi:hypothetical protein